MGRDEGGGGVARSSGAGHDAHDHVSLVAEAHARVQGAGVLVALHHVQERQLTARELAANEKKIEQVLSRLGVDRVDVAYGDTWMDIPLLEHADHPVAVYPDEKLKALAKERGWEVIGETPWYS